MLTSWQLSQLIDPVICRVQATNEAHSSGFVDRAARSVLSQLERETSLHERGAWRHCRQQLQRWQWIDQQVIRFFQENPTGVGIEVDGGLSTRFHRISERLDWPQFFWRSINKVDVANCLEFVFPSLENHVSISSERPLTEWTCHVRWHNAIPKIAILAEEKPLVDWAEFTLLAAMIEDCLSVESPSIHAVISHSISDFLNRVNTGLGGVSVISAMPESTPEKGLIARLRQLFFQSQPTVQCHHVIFFRPAVAELESAQ